MFCWGFSVYKYNKAQEQVNQLSHSSLHTQRHKLFNKHCRGEHVRAVSLLYVYKAVCFLWRTKSLLEGTFLIYSAVGSKKHTKLMLVNRSRFFIYKQLGDKLTTLADRFFFPILPSCTCGLMPNTENLKGFTLFLSPPASLRLLHNENSFCFWRLILLTNKRVYISNIKRCWFQNLNNSAALFWWLLLWVKPEFPSFISKKR